MNPINSLSKDTILNNTTAESIFKFYLQTENINKNLSSPFSNDQKPSFRAYKNGTFKCNSTGKQGDVFQFVADLKNLDCNKDFPKVLQTIHDDLNLIINLNNPITKEVQTKKENIANHKLNIIEIEMNQKHLDFWQKLGVQKELLQKYNVFAISNYNFFSTEKNKRFSFDLKDEIAFAYKVNDNYEVYKPAQNNKEKIFNRGLANIDVFGLDQIKTKVDNLIICAGKKDVLVAVSRGFNAITFQSETYYTKKEQIEFLKSLCDNLFICYDNDTTGIKFSNKIISTYNDIINIELPKNEIKGFDITDYFQKYSKEDFQELINLAVKNKSVKIEKENTNFENNKYIEYELPKEIKEPIENYINDILKYGLFMANCKIWILKISDKKKIFYEVSNFEIEILQHMQDEKTPLKLIRIKNIYNEENVFDIPSNLINTLTSFDNVMTSNGKYLFTGAKKDFDLLRGYLYDKMSTGKKIDSLGFQKEFNIWIWNNKVNLFNGESLYIDENGIFKHNNNSFYVPSANKIYKNNNAKYISQKKFKINNANISFEEYLKLFYKVYGEHFITSILFSIGSIFQDIIVNETKFFPILFLQGQASSGKDNLAFCCQSFLGTPQDKISIGAGVSTQKAQIRELAQFVNGISQFAEYKTGDKTTDEILKGIWDRNGYKIGTIESKVSTDVIPVLNSLILTSNNIPIDEALISRLLWVNLDKNSGFTEENISNYDKLVDLTNYGISSFSDDLFYFRNKFDDNFKELYRKNKKRLTDLFGDAIVRIPSNYAVLYSVFEFFSKYIKFPFTENEMKLYFIKNSIFQTNKIKTSNIVSRWWDCFYECLVSSFENKIIIDNDFKISGSLITFNFTNIYGKVQRLWYNQYKENIPAKNTMQEALLKSSSFTEQKNSQRIGQIVTSSYVFDIQKIDIATDLLDRIDKIRNN